MSRCLPVFLLLVFFVPGAFAQKKRPVQPQNFHIKELAKGVWAAIHNDNYGRAICNAGIVDLGDKTLIFDPFMTPAAAEELKEAAESLTGRPVTLVVNSHYHNDHIRGNQVFAPIATIISTNFTRNRIAEVEPEGQAWERRHAPGLLKATRQIYQNATGIEKEELPIWIGYYEGLMESLDELKITLPDIIFCDSLWILGSERDIKLMEFKDGHTGSDVVMCIPSERIAFTGDLLFVDRHPWMSDGDPVHWQENLQQLYNDKFINTYVPGHGSICEKAGVLKFRDYLKTMQTMVESAADDSVKTANILQAIPAQYRNWYFSRFYQNNLKFLLENYVRRKEEIPVPQ